MSPTINLFLHLISGLNLPFRLIQMGKHDDQEMMELVKNVMESQ